MPGLDAQSNLSQSATPVVSPSATEAVLKVESNDSNSCDRRRRLIGFHSARALSQRGRPVINLDNLNDYYNVNLMRARLDRLQSMPGFSSVRINLTDAAAIAELFNVHNFVTALNLATQVGVQYSLVNPQAYMKSNIEGFINVLETYRHQVHHQLYASSSSVYGSVTKMPISAHQNVDHPVSMYAATKKANELLTHSYSRLFALPRTGVRFFTVYGP